MRVLLCFACILLFIPSVRSAAPPRPVHTLIDSVAAAHAGAEAVSFAYQQTIRFTLTGETQVCAGTGRAASGGRFRVTQISPESQTTVSDGKKVWVYTPRFQQATIDSFKDWSRMSTLPIDIIGARGDFSQAASEYILRSVPDEQRGGGAIVFEPRRAGRSAFKIDCNANFMPGRITLAGDGFEAEVVISSYIFVSAARADYAFTPPRGTEIIDSRSLRAGRTR